MKAKRHQVLVSIESRIKETVTAPGGMEFFIQTDELHSTEQVTQTGVAVAVGEDVKGVNVGDEVFFRWTVTHDTDYNILYGDVNVWIINCIIKHGIPDLFAVITGGEIKPVCGFAFVEPQEDEVGFGEYKETKLNEKWGIMRFMEEGHGLSPGDKVFFGTRNDDDADLNTVLGKKYYIMEASRIQMKLEA